MSPSRNLFFVLSLAGFAFGCVIIKDSLSKEGLIFGVGVLVSSIEFFAIGIFIIYGAKLRDNIFKLESCPSCKTKSISIKEKLKSTYYDDNSYSFCPQCGCKVKLHISNFVLMLPLILLPFMMLLAFKSAMAMIFTILIVMPVGLWIYSKYVPLVKAGI